MAQTFRVENPVSAGGVVYRLVDGQTEIVICNIKASSTWGLPKGTPDSDETREQTALREVREETGLEVDIEGYIDSVDYWFVRTAERVRYHKTVIFYLMSPTGGDMSLHDHEFDVVQWLPAEEALKTLTYKNEVRVVQKGLSMVPQVGPIH